MPPDDVIGARGLSPAAVVAAIDSRAERIATPCGTGSMIWRHWGSGSGRAPALVLLHGGYGSWTHWLRNVENLATRYRVLACDLPGLGESADAPKPYSAESLAAIVADGIRRVVPGESVALCGFSFGSVIGGHVAAQMGNTVASFLMLGAAGLGAQRRGLPLTRVEPGMTPAQIASVQRNNLIMLMFGDASKVDDLAVYLQNENTRRGRLDSRPIAFTDTLIHTLPKATARLGAMWGEQDATAVDAIEQNFAVLRQIDPGIYCDTIAHAGHWAQWEQAKTFETKLTAFIEGNV
ncbi:MAG TPA: alpha/beta fold hydrolase [Stellaceae bacterium]|nr:alpha/beta fold hydrolase [Stellaceae bacterium]